MAIQGVRLSHGHHVERTSPKVGGWIEADLGRFLTSVPPEDPVFVLVNLLEAHEPYFGVLGRDGQPLADWLWAYSGALDRSDWRQGRKSPTMRDLARITLLYRAAVESVDQRLGSILATFDASREVDKTDVVVVGDHGQA